MNMAIPASEEIAIIGAGAWGTALALAAARAGRRVILWGRDRDGLAAMAEARENSAHLPGIPLAPAIMPTADPHLLRNVPVLLLVLPAQAAHATLDMLRPHLDSARALILCCKGIERPSGRFLSDILAPLLPHAVIGALSGPSFAQDVARGLPTAVTLALPDKESGEALAAALSSASFRPYLTGDVRGVEIGGALKNVYAIAAGIVIGCGLGDSARAALIARSFAEMQRFGQAFGARAETLSGLSGLGDLVLTATSEQSRNLRFGLAVGQGEGIPAARYRLGTVEGIATAEALHGLANQHAVDMPVASAVAAIIAGTLNVDSAIEALMRRPLKYETTV